MDTLVDREARNPYYRYWRHVAMPLSASLVAHLVLVILLAFKSFDVGAGAAAVSDYEASLTDSVGDQLRDAFQWSSSDPLEALQAPVEDDSFQSLAALDVPDDRLSELSSDLASVSAAAGPGLGLGDGALSLLGTGGGAAEAGSGGFGSGLGGTGGLGQSGLWGLQFRAARVVYVVDFSGSITAVVEPLKRELKRSVGQLLPAQSFNVIVFFSTPGVDAGAAQHESFATDLAPATEDRKRAFFSWIDRRAPQGKTAPVGAIRRSLEMKPELILLHSDGYFDDEQAAAKIIELVRKARVKLHCLVFDELLFDEPRGLPARATLGVEAMRSIAQGAGGSFKIVTSKDLARSAGR